MSIFPAPRPGRAAFLGRGFDPEPLTGQTLRKGDEGAYIPCFSAEVILLLCHRAYQHSLPRRSVPGAAGGVMPADAAPRPSCFLPAR